MCNKCEALQVVVACLRDSNARLYRERFAPVTPGEAGDALFKLARQCDELKKALRKRALTKSEARATFLPHIKGIEKSRDLVKAKAAAEIGELQARIAELELLAEAGGNCCAVMALPCEDARPAASIVCMSSIIGFKR